MSSAERGFLERVREDRLKLQPPPPMEKTMARMRAEDRENRRIEKLRTKSLHHLDQSKLDPMLKGLAVLVDGAILEGRNFFDNREELRVPKKEEAYPMVVPLSEESVVLTLLWDPEMDQDNNGVYIAKAIIVEAFPEGNIFIYGNSLWGTSHATLQERNEDEKLQERMLEKAYQAPKITYYYLDDGQPRLIYHSIHNEEEPQLL